MFRVPLHLLTQPESWAVWAVLALLCAAYAFGVVRGMRESTEGWEASWLVVIGNAIVSVAASLVVGLSTDVETGATILIVLLLTNGFAGIPMILEHQGWYKSMRKQERRNAQLRSMLPEEGDD